MLYFQWRYHQWKILLQTTILLFSFQLIAKCPYFLTHVFVLLTGENSQLKYKDMHYSNWGRTCCRGRRNSATALHTPSSGICPPSLAAAWGGHIPHHPTLMGKYVLRTSCHSQQQHPAQFVSQQINSEATWNSWADPAVYLPAGSNKRHLSFFSPNLTTWFPLFSSPVLVACWTNSAFQNNRTLFSISLFLYIIVRLLFCLCG